MGYTDHCSTKLREILIENLKTGVPVENDKILIVNSHSPERLSGNPFLHHLLAYSLSIHHEDLPESE